MIEDLANIAEPSNGSPKLPVIAIIEHQMLARSCIVNVLKRELSGFEIVEFVFDKRSERVGRKRYSPDRLQYHRQEGDHRPLESRIVSALIKEFCPNAYVALLSNRDDEATASAAMQRGVHGFFPTSIAIEIAIAGLRLVLAGSPRLGHATSLRAAAKCASPPRLSVVNEDACVATRSCLKGRWST